MSKPLVPLRCDFDIRVLYCGRIFYDSPHAPDGDGIVKFPVCVTLKIES